MQHLTSEEIKKLLQKVPNSRHKLMLKVGYLHGLRVSELINLTRESIRDGYINVQRLKGSLKTIQPYVSSTDPEIDEAVELGALYGTLKPTERLFPMTRDNVNKIMLKAGTLAGLPRHKIHPHALKHSCAMHLITKKIGLEDLRVFLGHKSLNSTGAYLRVSDEVASRAAISAFNS